MNFDTSVLFALIFFFYFLMFFSPFPWWSSGLILIKCEDNKKNIPHWEDHKRDKLNFITDAFPCFYYSTANRNEWDSISLSPLFSFSIESIFRDSFILPLPFFFSSLHIQYLKSLSESLFRDAFSCFHYSTADPKGSDCIEKFADMQVCMQVRVKDPHLHFAFIQGLECCLVVCRGRIR